jgi:Skp family chaperone for outer membrane proteins
MMHFKKIIIVLFFIFSYQQFALAELPYYLDFKYILNESDAGKKAQINLKNKLNNGIKSLNEREKSLQQQEKKIIEQKKIISVEEYKKKVQELRAKVTTLQKDRNELLAKIAKQRSNARNELLKNLNPIIKEYMQEKKIRYVMDKKSLILADESLDITKDVIKLLNSKLKTIKLN